MRALELSQNIKKPAIRQLAETGFLLYVLFSILFRLISHAFEENVSETSLSWCQIVLGHDNHGPSSKMTISTL